MADIPSLDELPTLAEMLGTDIDPRPQGYMALGCSHERNAGPYDGNTLASASNPVYTHPNDAVPAGSYHPCGPTHPNVTTLHNSRPVAMPESNRFPDVAPPFSWPIYYPAGIFSRYAFRPETREYPRSDYDNSTDRFQFGHSGPASAIDPDLAGDSRLGNSMYGIDRQEPAYSGDTSQDNTFLQAARCESALPRRTPSLLPLFNGNLQEFSERTMDDANGLINTLPSQDYYRDCKEIITHLMVVVVRYARTTADLRTELAEAESLFQELRASKRDMKRQIERLREENQVLKRASSAMHGAEA